MTRSQFNKSHYETIPT